MQLEPTGSGIKIQCVPSLEPFHQRLRVFYEHEISGYLSPPCFGNRVRYLWSVQKKKNQMTAVAMV